MPSLDLLTQNEDAVINTEGPTMNKSLFAYNTLVNNLARDPSDPVLYDTSMLTTLFRDAVGGNSFTLSIHCLMHGDVRGSDANLKLMNKL